MRNPDTVPHITLLSRTAYSSYAAYESKTESTILISNVRRNVQRYMSEQFLINIWISTSGDSSQNNNGTTILLVLDKLSVVAGTSFGPD